MENGRRIDAKPRRSKQYPKGRVCKSDKCEQVLSIYNSREYCFQHHPFRQPRVRGHEIIDI